MLTEVMLFALGLVLLVGGGTSLVRGASSLAASFGIPPLVIGLTVVAYGTSAPEMAVSVASSFMGQPHMAVGNVVGSNIFNVLFILGLSAMIAPLVVTRRLVMVEVPIMVLVSAIAWGMAANGVIGQVEAAVLLLGAVSYTVFQIVEGRKQGREEDKKDNRPPATGADHMKNIGWIVLGLVLLVGGSRFLVDSAISIARVLGVSETVISLTIVAAGTSLPEVATSVIATIRGERDIAVGNVVGSNIFNVLSVLGLSGLVSTGGLPVNPGILSFDLPVMMAVAFACLPIFFSGHLIARWEGFVFFGYYIAYTALLVMNASQHGARDEFATAMIWFVLPLTVLTIAVGTWRQFKGDGATPAKS